MGGRETVCAQAHTNSPSGELECVEAHTNSMAEAIAQVLQEHGVFPRPAAEIAEVMDEQGLTPDEALEVFLDVLAVTDDIGRAVYRLQSGFWDTTAQDRALDKARRRRYRASISKGVSPEGLKKSPPPPTVVAPGPSVHTPVSAFGTAEQVWQAALKQLELEMTRATFNTHFRRSRLVAYDDEVFTVAVINNYARDWLENRLAPAVRRVLRRLTGRDDASVRFVTEAEWAERSNTEAAQ